MGFDLSPGLRACMFFFFPVLAWAEPPVIKELWSPEERVLGTAPGAVLLIKGSGFSSETVMAAAPPYPLQLAGVKVLVDRTECPIMMVSPSAIQAQAPFGISSQKAGAAVELSVRNPDGEAALELSLGKTMPSLITEGRDGAGDAVVLDENLMPNRAPREGDVIILQAMGLGETEPSATAGLAASAREPFMAVKEKVEAWIGDKPVEVLWAGLSPRLSGIYQVKVRMPEGGGATVRLRTEGWREVRANLPQSTSPGPVTDVSGDIEALGVPSRPATWAPILLAAKLRVAMTIAEGAGPFDVLLENEAATVKVAVSPANGTFQVRSVVPTPAARNFDFSRAAFQTADFLAGGAPTPGNIIPASRVPPEYANALRTIPQPNAAGESNSVNWPFTSEWRIPAGGRLILDPDVTPGLAAAAWLPLPRDAPNNYRTVFTLKVAGQEVSRKEVTIPVR